MMSSFSSLSPDQFVLHTIYVSENVRGLEWGVKPSSPSLSHAYKKVLRKERWRKVAGKNGKKKRWLSLYLMN